MRIRKTMRTQKTRRKDGKFHKYLPRVFCFFVTPFTSRSTIFARRRANRPFLSSSSSSSRTAYEPKLGYSFTGLRADALSSTVEWNRRSVPKSLQQTIGPSSRRGKIGPTGHGFRDCDCISCCQVGNTPTSSISTLSPLSPWVIFAKATFQ
jgi:hypothetical protein